MEIKTLLKLRRKLKKKKPEFKRQEYFKHKKLKKKWRKPRGRHSKFRKGEKARGKKPSPGYSSPKAVRGLSREGFKRIMVANQKDLEKIKKPKEEIAVIKSGVGKKKRLEIAKKAKEMKIKIANI